MKKVLSVVLTILLIASCTVPAMFVSAEEGRLKPSFSEGFLYYEVNNGEISGDASIAYGDWYGGRPGATDNIFVCLHGGSVNLNIDVPYAGYYKIGVSGSTYNENDDVYASVWVNGSEYYFLADNEQFCEWPVVNVSVYDYGIGNFATAGGIWLDAGSNTLSVNTNNGWILIDRLAISVDSIIIPDNDGVAVVKNAITNLPEVLNEENYTVVAAVKEQYDALSEFQKSLVSNYNDLLSKIEEAKSFGLIPHEIYNDAGFSYQVEKGILAGDAFVDTSVSGYTGEGFVNIAGGSVTMNINVPYSGTYHIYVASSSDNNANDRFDKLTVNDTETVYHVSSPASNFGTWNVTVAGSDYYWENDVIIMMVPYPVELNKGENTITISADWGYGCYDRVVLKPEILNYVEGDPALVTTEMINALPETVSVVDKDAVQAAKSAYDDLDATGRVAVTNYDKLKVAFEEMIELNVVEATIVDDTYVYEIEDAMHTDRSFVGADESASAGKYINIAYGALYMNINVPVAGNYQLKVFGSTNDAENSKCDYVLVNGNQVGLVAYSDDTYGFWAESQPGSENWVDGNLQPIPSEDGIALTEGNNMVVIKANWGNTNYDKLVLVPINNEVEGDVNGDGILDATDVVAVRKQLLSETNLEFADANGDGVVNILDLIKVKKLLVGL